MKKSVIYINSRPRNSLRRVFLVALNIILLSAVIIFAVNVLLPDLFSSSVSSSPESKVYSEDAPVWENSAGNTNATEDESWWQAIIARIPFLAEKFSGSSVTAQLSSSDAAGQKTSATTESRSKQKSALTQENTSEAKPAAMENASEAKSTATESSGSSQTENAARENTVGNKDQSAQPEKSQTEKSWSEKSWWEQFFLPDDADTRPWWRRLLNLAPEQAENAVQETAHLASNANGERGERAEEAVPLVANADGETVDSPDAAKEVEDFEETGEVFDPATPSSPVIYAENPRYTMEVNDSAQQIFRSTVSRGDSAGSILNEWIGQKQIYDFVDLCKPVYQITKIKEGQPFSIVRDANTQDFISFIYEIDDTQRLIIERKDANFSVRMENIEYETRLVRVEGVIETSLFESVTSVGESSAFAVSLGDIYASEINFITDIRKGDSYTALVEKRYRNNEFSGYGRVIAARFINQGNSFEAFLFPDKNGLWHNYNAKGEALQKSILKAPLSFTRVSSVYSMNRRHPVYGDVRAHQGIDYAAPRGTPVQSVGDGTITKVGWSGGYGNTIIVKHYNGLESQYAHLNKFAKGIKIGTKVRQGQTIGYVGSTGTATGPHLDFRMIQNGKFVNPDKLIIPRAAPVEKNRLAEFEKSKLQALAFLNGQRELALYDIDDWTVTGKKSTN